MSNAPGGGPSALRQSYVGDSARSPADALRYSMSPAAPTSVMANWLAQQENLAPQFSSVYSQDAFKSDPLNVRAAKITWLLNNSNQWSGPGRAHAALEPQAALFSQANIPGITAPGGAGAPTGQVNVTLNPTPAGGTPPADPGPSGGGGAPGGGETPAQSDGTSAGAPGEAGGPGESGGLPSGAPPGSSFGEGGLAFGPSSDLSSLNTFAGRTALTGLGLAPHMGPVSGLVSGMMGLETGLSLFAGAFPNAARAMGLAPSTVIGNLPGQLSPEVTPAFRAQRAGERSGMGLDPNEAAPVDISLTPEADISGITGIPSGMPAPAPAPAPDEGVPEGSVTVGGIGPGVPGVPGPDVSESAQGLGDTAGGAPAASSEGGQVSTEGVTSDTGITAGDEGSGDGGGGGGGGGDGGCFLANWTINALHPKDEKQAKKFFREFYDGFMRLQGTSGRRLFALYQVAARRIINAAEKQGPETVKKVQQEIYDRLVKPTGKSVEEKEIPTAVKNLVQVVTDLSQRFKVPLSGDQQRAAQTFMRGAQPPMFKGRGRQA